MWVCILDYYSAICYFVNYLLDESAVQRNKQPQYEHLLVSQSWIDQNTLYKINSIEIKNKQKEKKGNFASEQQE